MKQYYAGEIINDPSGWPLGKVVEVDGQRILVEFLQGDIDGATDWFTLVELPDWMIE
jgi:hypothetical protein